MKYLHPIYIGMLSLGLHMLLGVDYHYTNWSSYAFNNSTYAYLIDNNNIILGGSYTPNKLDIHSYFNKM